MWKASPVLVRTVQPAGATSNPTGAGAQRCRLRASPLMTGPSGCWVRRHMSPMKANVPWGSLGDWIIHCREICMHGLQLRFHNQPPNEEKVSGATSRYLPVAAVARQAPCREKIGRASGRERVGQEG